MVPFVRPFILNDRANCAIKGCSGDVFLIRNSLRYLSDRVMDSTK